MKKDKPEALFEKGSLVKAYSYIIDHGVYEGPNNGPLIVLDSWWASQERAWVYDLYDPDRRYTHYSIIEGLVQHYD